MKGTTMAKPVAVIEIKVNQDKRNHQDQIASAAGEVRRDKAQVDEIRERVESAVERLPEWEEVVNLMAALEVARENLSMAISRMTGLNDLKEELAAARAILRGSQGELNSLLVHYIAKYQEKSLMVNHEHRRIDVKAKIGKAVSEQEVLPL